jgi:hypothetical protein
MFGSFNAWRSHEMDHRREWFCPLCNLRHHDKSNARVHLMHHHGELAEHHEIEMLLQTSSHPSENLPADDCPFCDWGMTLRKKNNTPKEHDLMVPSRRFMKHLGRHLEEIALFVIPQPEEEQRSSGDTASNAVHAVLDQDSATGSKISNFKSQPSIGASATDEYGEEPPSDDFYTGSCTDPTCPDPTCGRHVKVLKAHMSTIQDAWPEKCPIPSCNYHKKGFARKYDKDRHISTHYKGNLICGFCPGSGTAAEKIFYRADVFKRHLTSVHGVERTHSNASRRLDHEPLSQTAHHKFAGLCSTCGITFANAQQLYEHLDDCVLRVIQQQQAHDSTFASTRVEDWDKVQAQVYQYYVQDKMSLALVKEKMSKEHSFDASERAYRRKLMKWNFKQHESALGNHGTDAGPASKDHSDHVLESAHAKPLDTVARHEFFLSRDSSYFSVGRVFDVIWTEAVAQDTWVDSITKKAISERFEDRTYSIFRRFVVVKEGAHHCTALPISTYNGQGAANPGVIKSEHAIIFSGQNVPSIGASELPSRGEAPLKQPPIRVDLDDAIKRLDPMSRIDLGGVHMIRHHVETKSIGQIHKDSLKDLLQQFHDVSNAPKTPEPAGAGKAGIASDVVEDEDEIAYIEVSESEIGSPADSSDNDSQEYDSGPERKGDESEIEIPNDDSDRGSLEDESEREIEDGESEGEIQDDESDSEYPGY